MEATAATMKITKKLYSVQSNAMTKTKSQESFPEDDFKIKEVSVSQTVRNS